MQLYLDVCLPLYPVQKYINPPSKHFALTICHDAFHILCKALSCPAVDMCEKNKLAVYCLAAYVLLWLKKKGIYFLLLHLL